MINSWLPSKPSFFGKQRHGSKKGSIERHKQYRPNAPVSTRWGPIQGIGLETGEPPVFNTEYEACAKVAREHHLAFLEVYRAVQKL